MALGDIHAPVCVAGVALVELAQHFAWQACYLDDLVTCTLLARGRRGHLVSFTLLLFGRRLACGNSLKMH